MKHLFISYELANTAKEKGFDEPCLAMYDDEKINMWLQDLYDFRSEGEEDGFQFKNSMWDDSRFIAAPSHQQIIDWFREVHNLHITIIPLGAQQNGNKPTKTMYDYYVTLHYMYADTNLDEKGGGIPEFKNYYDALNKAIDEAFKLI